MVRYNGLFACNSLYLVAGFSQACTLEETVENIQFVGPKIQKTSDVSCIPPILYYFILLSFNHTSQYR